MLPRGWPLVQRSELYPAVDAPEPAAIDTLGAARLADATPKSSAADRCAARWAWFSAHSFIRRWAAPRPECARVTLTRWPVALANRRSRQGGSSTWLTISSAGQLQV
jgi:hypothetical protein